MKYELVINLTNGTQIIEQSNDKNQMVERFNGAKGMIEGKLMGYKNATLIDWETYGKISYGE